MTGNATLHATSPQHHLLPASAHITCGAGSYSREQQYEAFALRAASFRRFLVSLRFASILLQLFRYVLDCRYHLERAAYPPIRRTSMDESAAKNFNPHHARVLVVGPMAAGKTTLVHSLCHGANGATSGAMQQQRPPPTVGCNVDVKVLQGRVAVSLRGAH